MRWRHRLTLKILYPTADFQGYNKIMIPRPSLIQAVTDRLEHSPIVVLLGPRQCGKTTLAREIARRGQCEYFDLENPVDLARLEAPMLALEDLRGLVIIDEVQRKVELFEILRVLADRPEFKATVLLLGSASPHLVRGASESLAGRVAFVEMSGFDLREVGVKEFRRLWLRGSCRIPK